MRALAACLTVLALVGHAKADRFRSVLVGGDTDWQTSGGSQGCDFCSQKHDGQTHQGGDYHKSYSSRYSSSRKVAPSYSSSWGSEDLSGSGLLGRSGGGRRTYHYSSEESEYTFSNGTHSTTITSKRSSEGVPEFHLKMTRLRDGAIIESTVLSESEYRRRRASLGLTGSDGSFGFESLGGRDVHALGAHGLSEEDLLTDLERRLDRRRGGHSRHSTTRFSSEESHYSFSNGTHTTSITGRRNSDGVREYGLKLIRDSDGALLDRATISEAEYNRRRQSMTSGEGFDNVFDIHGIRGSGSRSSEYDSRIDSRSRSRSRSDGRSDRRKDSRYASHHDSRIDSRSRFRSEIDSASKESEFDSHSSGGRSVPAGSPDSSGSRTTTYFREERTESRQHSRDEACSCVERSGCRIADRVYSTEAMLRCDGDEVCCRRSQPRRPAPAHPTEKPRYSQPPRPRAEPQVSEPTCSCVSRDSCSYREREYSVAALEKCRRPLVCCRRQTPASGSDRLPTPPRATRPAPRRTTPNPAFVEQERELFRDIVQHVDTEDAPSQRQLNTNDLQSSISRYDDAHAVPGGHRRTETTRTEHSRTETSGGRYRPRQPATSGQRTSTTSSRRQSYSGRSTSSSSDDDRPRPDSDDGLIRSSSTYSYRRTSSGSTDADDGPGRPYGASRSQHRQDAGGHDDSSGGRRIISSSRRYSERRTISGEDSDEDERPILGSGRRESFRREQQYSAQRPLDLPDRGVDSSSSHRYSYRRSSSSSSSSGDLGEAGRLLGAGGAGRRSFEGSLHGQHTDQHAEPVVTSSSHYRSVQRTVSDGSGGDLPVSGSGGLERSHGERHLVSGIAGGEDLGLGTTRGAGGHSSSSRYSSSSSWSSRSESGSSGELVPSVTHTYQAGPSGRSGSSYRYSSSTRSSQTVPAPSTSSSSWSRYSQHSERHKRGWSSLFRSDDEEPSVYDRDRDTCVCVRFDRCSDGNLLHHGADLLDFSIGSRKQCSGLRVCCDMPPEVLSQLEATPGLRPGVVTSVPTAGLRLPSSSRTAPLAPHVSGDRPCVCVSSYLCQDGTIAASQQLLVDMRQVSQTGRCSYQDQVCCAVPWSQVQPTPTPPPPLCTCVSGNQCRQQDILTRYTNPNAPTCPGTQVCCTRPPRGHDYDDDYDTHISRDEFNMYLFCKSYPLSVACFNTHQFSYQPTIWPTRGFDAYADASALNQALNGNAGPFNIFRSFKTNDKVLIDILTRRTFKERAHIKTSYKTLTGKELRDDVRKGTTGNYENFMLDLLDGSSMEEYLAKRLHEGMDGIGTDEDVVLETLISSTNEEIAAIKPFFYIESGHTLEDDIADDFSGDLEDMLVALASGSRDGSLMVDQHRAREAAEALRRAGGDRLGTEEETFKYYLTHENYAQLMLIFSQYELLTGDSFSDALEHEFSRHTEEAVLAIVEVTKNLPAYFAGRLYDALWSKGVFGKDDSSLRRILISRAERDLGSIAQEYHKRYGTSLRDDIETKASGDYEDALLSLLGYTS